MSVSRVIVSVVLVASSGCTKPLITRHVLPPPVNSYILPSHQVMLVGVLPFLDQTKRAGILQLAVADALTTELHKTGRFVLIDRQQFIEDLKRATTTMTTQRIREPNAKGAEQKSKSVSTIESVEYTPNCSDACKAFEILDITPSLNAVLSWGPVDAVLLGAVTGMEVDPTGDGGTATVDYRLVAVGKKRSEDILTENRYILTAGMGMLKFKGPLPLGPMSIDRNSVAQLARQLVSSLPSSLKPDAVKVVEKYGKNGDFWVISAGLLNNVRRGLEGYVVEPSASSDALLYVAAFTVVDVFEHSAIVIIRTSNHLEVAGRAVVFR